MAKIKKKKKPIKKPVKRIKKKDEMPDIIFDSTVNNTDSLFVSEPEPQLPPQPQPQLPKEENKPVTEPAITEALKDLEDLEKIQKVGNNQNMQDQKQNTKKPFWKRIFPFFLILVFISLSAETAFATSPGPIDSTYKYAWSNNIGWINFGCLNCNVRVWNDHISGYAWSETYGWINLEPSEGGVENDGNGTLSGYAWGESAGWINFTGVSINSSTGSFTGTATGSIVGTVAFTSCGDTCGVKTSWRPGSDVGGEENTPTTPAPNVFTGAFSIMINSGASVTNNKTVTIKLSSDVDVKEYVISNSSSLSGLVAQTFEAQKTWDLTIGDGSKTVYTKFFDKDGKESAVISATITLDTKAPDVTINQQTIHKSGDNVIVSGKLSEPGELIFSWDDQSGIVKTDSSNNWIANFGKMKVGTTLVSLEAIDTAENKKTQTFQVVVVEGTQNNQEENTQEENQNNQGENQTGQNGENNQNQTTGQSQGNSVVQSVEGGIKSLVNLFKFDRKNDNNQALSEPEKMVTVPKELPYVFKGKWKIFTIDKFKIK